MGSRVPAHPASKFSSSIRLRSIRLRSIRLRWIRLPRQISPWRSGSSAGFAVLFVLLGNCGLESAEANGDTRTLTLHHLHTDENITITYKRDGRYDDEALKKLDHFLRDWRKDESIHMDPHLFDVVWEVAREFGKDGVIQVVCGYRSPSTNAMLRRRSRGVAQFSQHTLGKAMDFYIHGASLEQIREAGLRLQRGGVGYYPTSGSPFVHLDVGNVRHWPRMTREQLVRVFPDGRTVHIPSDGQPLPGYALALADLQKRGASPPPNLLASIFHSDDDDDRSQPAPPPAANAPHGFNLASLSGPKAPDTKTPTARTSDTRTSDTRTSDTRTDSTRAQRTALAAVVATTDGSAGTGDRNEWTTSALGLTEPPRSGSEIHAPLSNPDNAPSLAPWPFRDADRDRVPLDMVLAYAAPPPDGAAVSDARAEASPDIVRAPSPPSGNPQRDAGIRDSNGAAAKTAPAATAVSAPTMSVHVVNVVVVTATPGMRYDDPWLRAMILAPRLYGSMTATLYGDRDLTELRSLMDKPAAAVAMSFARDPYPGIRPYSFSGEAIVQLSTITFSQRTAWLRP